MNFCSIEYLIFLPLIILLFFTTKHPYRWMVLFAGSCAFYMAFIPEYILYLFFLIIVDYFLAIKIFSSQKSSTRKIYLWISIISNFGLLFYFKYTGFFASNLNLLTEPLFGMSMKVRQEILPIGLSFHTFQSISYVIDVYRNKQVPEKHLGVYSNYVLFFPQMVAGPIERYSTLGVNLRQNIKFDLSAVKTGAQLILIGFFYKMVIADNCGIYVNNVYAHLETMNGMNVLLGIALFMVQIYCDFFGYSLIAQGSAKTIGVNLMDNFRNPLLSVSIVDFWKRWHISLTSWFREYVYFPLGGNRVGVLKHIRNIVIIFLLSGLWHGAGWNFIFWGALHAVFYILAVYGSGPVFEKIPVWIKYAATFILVAFIFVFFRSADLSMAVHIFKQSVDFSGTFDGNLLPLFLFVNILFVLIVELFQRRQINYASFISLTGPTIKAVVLIWMLFGVLVYSALDNIPFIYFQF